MTLRRLLPIILPVLLISALTFRADALAPKPPSNKEAPTPKPKPKPKFTITGDFSENLVCVKHKGKYGYIDKSCSIVIPCTYDLALDFKEGLANIEINGKYGFIDKSGKVVIPIN